ncbi:MAG: DUF4426 domain-containing protein [Pseudomonadota bacterium]
MRRWGVATTTSALLLALASGCSDTADGTRIPAPRQAPATALGADVSSLDTGDYVIYFNSFTTDQLTPEVARSYGITRGQRRVLLNVSVLKKNENGQNTPVKAEVVSNVANLSAQRKDLTFREIDEGGEAVYYIAELPVSSAETLMIELDVTPENESASQYLKFRRTFRF